MHYCTKCYINPGLQTKRKLYPYHNIVFLLPLSLHTCRWRRTHSYSGWLQLLTEREIKNGHELCLLRKEEQLTVFSSISHILYHLYTKQPSIPSVFVHVFMCKMYDPHFLLTRSRKCHLSLVSTITSAGSFSAGGVWVITAIVLIFTQFFFFWGGGASPKAPPGRATDSKH